jgi:predicted GIY-YIG superfamily endonuclease
VGSTNRLDKRVAEHNAGKVLSTKAHIPLVLVFNKSFDSEKEARHYEHLLKDKRLEKEALIKQIENDCGIV